MRAILKPRDVTWQMLESGGEILNSSPILAAITDLAVLPGISGGEQEAEGVGDIAHNTAGRINRQERHPVPSGPTSISTSGDNSTKILSKPLKVGIAGGRAVLATRAFDGVPGSSTGLGILEHGFGLDVTAEGAVGLPEGSTLFAQRAVLGGTDRHQEDRLSRSLTGGDGGPTDRRRGNEEKSCWNTTKDGHVLLLSDRVRSKSNVLTVSSDGKIAPAANGTNKVRNQQGNTPLLL